MYLYKANCYQNNVWVDYYTVVKKAHIGLLLAGVLQLNMDTFKFFCSKN